MNAALPKGIDLYGTSHGWPVCRVHYSSDPDKTEEWADREKAGYQSQALWMQEQEIKFGVGGGERLLKDTLLARWDEIVISTPFIPKRGWSWSAGFDYGQSSPTAWPVMAKDYFGVGYAIAEHYKSGTIMTPNRHAAEMHSMMILTDQGVVPAMELVKEKTYADPRCFDVTVAQSKGDYCSLASLYETAVDGSRPVPVRMRPGVRGDDLGFVNRLLQMWTAPKVLFRIVLPKRYSYTKKQEGTFSDGCPNLVWELLGIRRAKLSAAQLDTRSALETIVQKNNHIFDACKYYFSSDPLNAEFSREEVWEQKASAFVQEHPDMSPFQSVNAQIRMHREFEAEERREMVESWH